MKFDINETKQEQIDLSIMFCTIGVRFWEDASYWDQEFNVWVEEDEDNPTIPCKEGDVWKPVIDIDSKRILNWEYGKKYKVHFKCCDEFYCTIQNPEQEHIITYEGYVPSGIGEYGDYVVWEINEEGIITSGFDFTRETVEDLLDY